MSRVFLLAVLLLAAVSALISPAAAQRGTEREVVFQQSFPVADGGSLVVDVGAGSVRVETTASGRAEVVVEGRGEGVRAAFERLRFEAGVRGNRLTARTRGRGQMGRTQADFVYTIRIPRRFTVGVDTGSGNVTVGPLDGALTVDTGSGNVETARVGGRLSVDTGSGNVTVAELAGTGSVDTGSGNVTVALARVAPLVVGTGSGSVRVSVPRGSDATLALDGGTVRIDDALGFEGRRTARAASGRIGRGGDRIAVDTGSGGITVSAR